jgi:hypothetical protein
MVASADPASGDQNTFVDTCGFQLSQAKTEWGYQLNGANGIRIDFSLYPDTSLPQAKNSFEQLHTDHNVPIIYSAMRQDFFVITSVGSSVERYLRFHSIPGGVVGFGSHGTRPPAQTESAYPP